MSNVNDSPTPSRGEPSLGTHDDNNLYVRQWLNVESEVDMRGHDLWLDFGNDFRGWTRETFGLLETSLQKTLYKFLREREILFVDIGRRPLAQRLYNLLLETSWKEQLDLQAEQLRASEDRTDETPATTRQPSVVRNEHETPVVSGDSVSPREDPPPVTLPVTPRTPPPQRSVQFGSMPHYTPPRQRQYTHQPSQTPEPRPTWTNSQDVRQNMDLSQNPDRTGSPNRDDMPLYGTLARNPSVTMTNTTVNSVPYNVDNQASFQRALTTLMKVYRDPLKYKGSADNLDLKLRVFQDWCFKTGIEPPYFAPAFAVMLAGEAHDFFYRQIYHLGTDFDHMVNLVRANFETEERRRRAYNWWQSVSLEKIKGKHPKRSLIECFEAMRSRLLETQMRLRSPMWDDLTIRDRLLAACQTVPECFQAVLRPAPTFQAACEDIRNVLGLVSPSANATDVFHTSFDDDNNDSDDDPFDQFVIDRTVRGKNTRYGNRPQQPRQPYQNAGSNQASLPKIVTPSNCTCNICGRFGCISYNHKDEERRSHLNKVQSERRFSPTKAIQYVADMEGSHAFYALPDSSTNDENNDSATVSKVDDFVQDDFSTEVAGDINNSVALEMFITLSQQSIQHALAPTMMNSINKATSQTSRYDATTFMGICIDTGAARRSTGGLPQFTALQRTQKLRLIPAGGTITLGVTESKIIGTTRVTTPIGVVNFTIVEAAIPFLLSLQTMKDLRVVYNNLNDCLVQNGRHIPINLSFGHAWLQLEEAHALVSSPQVECAPDHAVTCHLTENELRRLHRRFGHPSTGRLYKLLERAGHDPQYKLIEKLTKFCQDCQRHGKAPGRFKFTLKDDAEFNHTVYVDVVQIDGKNVLHMVDKATSLNAAGFLKNLSSAEAWRVFKLCWSLIYIGPPAYIAHDPGRNFIGPAFKQGAVEDGVTLSPQPVEAHNSIGKVERYHTPLRRAYDLFLKGFPSIAKEERLQLAVKAVNDTAGPNGLVPTLLVFGAYPRISMLDAPPELTMERAKIVRKAMEEIRRLKASTGVRDALKMRNGPMTSHLADLPPGSNVLVWRAAKHTDKKGWKGPFQLTKIEGETATVMVKNTPIEFRTTIVRPYGGEDDGIDDETNLTIKEFLPEGQQQDEQSDDEQSVRNARNQNNAHQVRLNNESDETDQPDADNPPLSQNVRVVIPQTRLGSDIFIEDECDADVYDIWVTEKESRDRQLSLELRAKGIIRTPGGPFIFSRRKEIDGLMARGVFEIVQNNAPELVGAKVFGSRIVDEVKGKDTAAPYEKSRWVVQGFNDPNKHTILTSSPTIQRASQRVLLALAPTLRTMGVNLYLRDITQAYTQSTTPLTRTIYARPPPELVPEFPPNIVFRVVRPLYGIAEAGIHWFNTYHKHHCNELGMEPSTFDPCLLITRESNGPFGLVGMQTDDTLFLGDDQFVRLEDEKIREKKLLAKDLEKLSSETELRFNGCRALLDERTSTVSVLQKDQGKRLTEIDPKSDNAPQEYRQQRARGAYIASICQPEAACDLSMAAQFQAPTTPQIKGLNKTLKWQMDNQRRGLAYVPVDLKTAKLFVFVDGSLANNADFTSQIGYVIVLGNEQPSDGRFKLVGNILHWSSTKCKRVTRAILASELYAMVAGLDMAISISTTLNRIMKQLGFNDIPVVICTDSFSLYECMVKLGTTKEKRLMIDIMAIRQSYERRELSEIRWISGSTNMADAMTKERTKVNSALRTFVSTNELDIEVEGWIQRPDVVDNTMVASGS